jgi:hypothetical protein
MKNDKDWKKIGVIGVDAGLCWIGDPCYILGGKRPKAVGADWHAFCEKLSEGEVTQFKYDKGHDGLGVAVHTGFGDGLYDVFAKIVKLPGWGTRIAEVRIVFIDEEQIAEMSKPPKRRT